MKKEKLTNQTGFLYNTAQICHIWKHFLLPPCFELPADELCSFSHSYELSSTEYSDT